MPLSICSCNTNQEEKKKKERNMFFLISRSFLIYLEFQKQYKLFFLFKLHQFLEVLESDIGTKWEIYN